MKRALLICLILVVGLASSAGADIPGSLNYQGVLTDGAGLAVPDGVYSITFRIYDVSSGGTELWTETNNVQVTKGIFNVVLGTLVSLNLPFDEPYWMGMSVEGEAELVPRVTLTATAYSFNSKGVTGLSNKFPPSGNVGIGTMVPSYPLHVRSDDAVGIRFDGNSGSWAGIYANALQPGGQPVFGYCRGGLLLAGTYVTSDDRWNLLMGPEVRLAVTASGDIGMGTVIPVEKLDVEGAINIGTTSNTNAGTIRWTGADFEGYDGSTWQSLTATGGGSLPPGTAGQTLRHNGADWVATDYLYNDGSSIGIGTTSPGATVHIQGSGHQDIIVEPTLNSSSAVLELKTTDGTYDYLRFAKHGPAYGGSIDGIALADVGIMYTGTQGGPMLIDVMTANPMYFLTNNLERMRLDAGGNLGINTKTPEAKLHVDGNMWDLDNTEGDFKIGDSTHRLKFGVATGGLGAGTAGIRVMGGVEKLKLGAGLAEVLTIENDGTLMLGSDVLTGSMEIYNNGYSHPYLTITSSLHGPTLTTYDELNNSIASIQPDGNGTGGYFYVKRNEAGTAFRVDGNYLGSESPRVYIFGGSATTVFDMGTVGDASVEVPTGSISTDEIIGETGAVSYTEGISSVALETSPTLSIIGSQTISAPAAGYVLVIGTTQAQFGHTNGTTSQAEFGVSDDSGSLPANQDVLVYFPSTAATGTYAFPVTCHGLFEVTSGAHTFYLLGRETGTAPFTALDIQVTAVFIPTAYGTVEPTLASGGYVPDGDVRPAMTAADVAAQREASVAANTARIERELAEMRAEMEAIRQELENQKQ